jgi:hypothetical protein
LSLEEDETVSKVEEKQPVDKAVSKINMSVERHPPIFHAAPALPKSKPIVRDKTLMEAASKQPHVSYPDAASPGCLSSSRSSSTKMDISK